MLRCSRLSAVIDGKGVGRGLSRRRMGCDGIEEEGTPNCSVIDPGHCDHLITAGRRASQADKTVAKFKFELCSGSFIASPLLEALMTMQIRVPAYIARSNLGLHFLTETDCCKRQARLSNHVVRRSGHFLVKSCSKD